MARVQSVIRSRGSKVPRGHGHVARAAPKAAPKAAPAAEEAAPVEKLTMSNTKAELTAAAEAAGIEVKGSDTKAQILEALYAD